MGDILHTLPAVARLRAGVAGAEIAWVMDPRFAPLVQGTGLVDHLLPFERKKGLSVWIAWRWLRQWRAEWVVDFQGLWKSALIGLASGAERRVGFARPRESGAAVLYTERHETVGKHVVEWNEELAALVGGRAVGGGDVAPKGFAEGRLPEEPFVLAAPYAGWKSKQWPVERYAVLGERLWKGRGLRLVMNVMPGAALPESEYLWRHESGVEGLIDATRKAVAVVGLDSGPLHLAALLRKPGVGLFGPTDPERNGPYGGTVKVLRVAGAETTYKRGEAIAPSMEAIGVEQVWTALEEVLG